MSEMQVRKLQEWERLHLIHCTNCSLDIHQIIFVEPPIEHQIERARTPEDIEC